MLEHVPAWLGSLLSKVRAGHAKLAIADPALGAHDAIQSSSPAFGNGGRLPDRFTADGDGVSPPLVWGPIPPATATLALIVEDPDAPVSHPLAHAIAWDIAPDTHRIEEGALSLRSGDAAGGHPMIAIGRNSFRALGWLPPDPPTGHGSHDYVFQLFALSAPIDPGDKAGRGDVVAAMADKVIGAGMLVGTYSRGEPNTAAPGAGSPLGVAVAGGVA